MEADGGPTGVQWRLQIGVWEGFVRANVHIRSLAGQLRGGGGELGVWSFQSDRLS